MRQRKNRERRMKKKGRKGRTNKENIHILEFVFHVGKRRCIQSHQQALVHTMHLGSSMFCNAVTKFPASL